MTVDDLIELLQDMPESMRSLPVGFIDVNGFQSIEMIGTHLDQRRSRRVIVLEAEDGA